MFNENFDSNTIDQKVLDFESIQGQTCHYQAVSNILRYFGYQIPEEFVFLLLRAYYVEDPDINIPFFCNDSFDEIGFSLLIRHFNTKKSLFSTIKGLIISEKPAIINIKGNKLPYFPKNTEINLEEHLIVIYGYNQQEFLVSDVYVPFFPPEAITCWVDQEEIYQMIQEGNDPGRIFAIEPVEPKRITLDEIFQIGVKKIIQLMEKENQFRVRVIEARDINSLQFRPEDIHHLAKKTRSELLSNGGPVETRSFLAKIFNHACRNNKFLEECSDFFAQKSIEWKGIANACIKFAVLGQMDFFKEQIWISYKLAKEELEYISRLQELLNL